MLTYKKGDILKEQAEAIVNTVNTVGVMGKGIALQFKERYPENYRIYKKACEAGEVKTGKMFVTETGRFLNPKYIINFPTKEHWRNPSKMEYITEGLKDLVKVISDKNISSIALPPLGCGNGGLEWYKVRKEIEKYLAPFSDLELIVFEPSNIAYRKKKQTNRKQVNLTDVRAMFLSLFEKYKELGFNLSFIEAHKLIYFLQRFGEPLGLEFDKNRYGPFSPTIDHMLYDLEGVYLKGTKYREAKATDNIELIWANFDKVHAYIKENLSTEQKEHLNDVRSLIEGFESPLGMELLATVDYIISRSKEEPDLEELMEAIYNWGPENENWGGRKRKIMKKEYVKVAKDRLMEFENSLNKDKACSIQ
jgi:O-acetyl-ADP-ribose deacetylase (regulator of RNase III)